MCKKKDVVIYRKAIEFMSENLFEKILMSDIAEHCGVSQSWLEKTFKKYKTPGVMRYFLDLKLEYVAKRIKQGDSVNALAAKLNFSSSAHLSLSFKQKYGLSPLKYKYSTGITNKEAYLKSTPI